MIRTLKRFKQAQKEMFEQAYEEILSGKKTSHWIWYIFPQLEELGHSSTAKYYGIKNLKEAKKYYKDDYLRDNLLDICDALLRVQGKTISEIVDWDDVKVHSCITLFLQVDKDSAILNGVLRKYFNGELDINTLEALKSA